MLYDEFLAGTGAPANESTYEQYILINKIYSDCSDFTKDDAYNLWKKTYGRELKKLTRERDQKLLKLTVTKRQFDKLSANEKKAITRELERIYRLCLHGTPNNSNMSHFFPEGKVYLDKYNILWGVKYDEKSGCNRLYAVCNNMVIQTIYYLINI